VYVSQTAVSSAIFGTVIEGTKTFMQSIRVSDSVLFGQSSGGNTSTIAFFDLAVSKPRVVATVNSDGNRTAVTIDGA
jgi:hypothetical protein